MPVNSVLTNAYPYNTRVSRLTSPKTIPNHQSFTVPGSGGSDGIITNVTGTLVALESEGGEAWVFGYNRTALHVWPVYHPVTGCSGASAFSRARQQIWYCLPRGGTKLYSVAFAPLKGTRCGMATCYDPTKAEWTEVFDFAQCPQAPGGPTTWNSFLAVGAKDTDISVSVSWTGLQNTAHLFFDYLTGPHQCVTYDTVGNGKTPQWYTTSGEPNPVYNFVTGAELQASWTIHDSWTNGTWALVPDNQCTGADCGKPNAGPPVINLENHTAYVLSAYRKASGHHTMTASFYYAYDLPDEQRQLASPVEYAPTGPVWGCSPCEDSHFSGDIKNDANPLLGTRGGIATMTWTEPYMNEVYGLATDGSGTVYRFSPTWSSGPRTNFAGKYAIAGFSQDRRTAFFTSDMGCQLRSNCGTDVFAVDLTVD